MPKVSDGPFSHDGDLIGHPEPQARAVEILQEHGPMEYEDLKDHLGVEQAEMQSIMRHLRYNGLVKRSPESNGLVATLNHRIEQYVSETGPNEQYEAGYMEHVERYKCFRCGDEEFHAVLSRSGLSFLRCVTCDLPVDATHSSITGGVEA